MILNGDQILQRMNMGDIRITPFVPSHVGTNSYDVRLGDKILVMCDISPGNPIDLRKEKPKYVEIDLREKDFILQTGPFSFAQSFVLGSTLEYCETHAKDLVPMIDGRSTLARCGLSIHETAGFGDIGFCGNWTLEMTAKMPIILYPGMPIGQLFWYKCEPTERRYKGRYQGQSGTTGAKSF